MVKHNWYDVQRRCPDADPVQPPPAETLVNVHTAAAAESDELPGIGPSLAANIIASRPFSSVDDLLRVSGIGPAELDGIRGLVTVE